MLSFKRGFSLLCTKVSWCPSSSKAAFARIYCSAKLKFYWKRGNSRPFFFFFSRAECNRYGVIILTDFLKIEYFCPLHVKELIMFPLWHSKSILSALLSSNPLHWVLMGQVKYPLQHLTAILVNHLAMKNMHITEALATLHLISVFNLICTLRKHHSNYWRSVWDMNGILFAVGNKRKWSNL